MGRWSAVLLAIACLFPSSGCKSTSKSGSGGPSVTIRGNTPGQVLTIAEQVFAEQGYIVKLEAGNRLVCEKPASGLSNVAYGNWVWPNRVWLRVRVSAVTLGEAVVNLQCRAYHLRDRGETTEEELPISSLRSGPYAKLLKEVESRLTTPSR